MRILATSLFLCVFAAAASAQGSKCEVKVEADKVTADLNGKTGQFLGNVRVTQCEMKMRADQVRVTTINGEADKVVATGNVVVDSPKSGTVTGASGVYDAPRRMVTMSGNVVLKRGKDVMRGPQLTVNLATGLATVGGGVSATMTPGAAPQPPQQRVQAIFSAPSQGQ
jgi:lipopolysaccharide export system protein LptA